MTHAQVLLAQHVHILCIFHILQLSLSFLGAFSSSQLQIGFAADCMAHAQILFSQHQAAFDIFFIFCFSSCDFFVSYAGSFLEPSHDSAQVFSLVHYASEFIINLLHSVQSFNAHVQVDEVQTEEGQDAVDNNLGISRVLCQVSNLQVFFHYSSHLKNLSFLIFYKNRQFKSTHRN